jgi:N-acetyl-D-muramate 6-phosphate phosphatase
MSTSLAPTITTLLFDLDGTLLDTAPDLGAALNRVRAKHQLPAIPIAELSAYASQGARGLVFKGFGVTPDDAEFIALRDDFLMEYESNIAADTVYFEGIEAMLEGITQRGLKWGIITNKATRYTHLLLPYFAKLSQAPVVVCGDTLTTSKPDPAPLLHAAQQLGCSAEECAYIGDDIRDVQAANAAAMHSVIAGYGYCGGTPIQTWQAKHIAETPNDIFKVLSL